ncbi:16S rRNA (cytosine(967)-C(5))-methyltransferase RsmB [uncultured Piscinibacter sp.]|uniref:16S rRNA (cytosine(967)-C(5))-methyltransferase RsmB n=1 Tax=uncultured Piscinibacter sp. TaxID=1131835 RepID=UPI0026028BB9|nr:16S rRNA (cytosine(967)-C(5))-methyltransferase RsmB [uncultured Piscinibacter sp.]
MNVPASLPLAQLLTHAAAAVQAVRAGASLTDALERCPAAARPGAQALSFHALRWLGGALAARQRLVPKAPPAALDALLLTALALLWPGSGTPYAEHTLVDQAVVAARQRGGFVNAVLRRFLREREALLAALENDLTARYNHPRWWIDRLQRDWPQRWQAVLEADQQRAPMTLRVNRRRSSVAAYIARLAEAGMTASALPGTQAVVLAQPVPVQQLPGFADGDVSVQDAAAQRAAPLLIGAGLPAGARVLDACAAPGGKTAHLLELADLDLLALDSDAQRLARVHDTLTRLHLSAGTVAADAGDPASWWDGRPFDAILLDAPCSASGIVRRHPDVRWLRRSSDIAALARTQARLLDALWPTLRPGGRLLYCTCSVFKAEGQEQIDAFLQRHGDAAPAADPSVPGHLLPLPDNQPDRSPPPAAASADGFFYGLLLKT